MILTALWRRFVPLGMGHLQSTPLNDGEVRGIARLVSSDNVPAYEVGQLEEEGQARLGKAVRRD